MTNEKQPRTLASWKNSLWIHQVAHKWLQSLCHTDGLNDALVLCHAQRKRCMLWEAGILAVTERFKRSKAKLSHNYRQIISGSKTKPFHPHPH